MMGRVGLAEPRSSCEAPAMPRLPAPAATLVLALVLSAPASAAPALERQVHGSLAVELVRGWKVRFEPSQGLLAAAERPKDERSPALVFLLKPEPKLDLTPEQLADALIDASGARREDRRRRKIDGPRAILIETTLELPAGRFEGVAFASVDHGAKQAIGAFFMALPEDFRRLGGVDHLLRVAASIGPADAPPPPPPAPAGHRPLEGVAATTRVVGGAWVEAADGSGPEATSSGPRYRFEPGGRYRIEHAPSETRAYCRREAKIREEGRWRLEADSLVLAPSGWRFAVCTCTCPDLRTERTGEGRLPERRYAIRADPDGRGLVLRGLCAPWRSEPGCRRGARLGDLPADSDLVRDLRLVRP
jgi:hypothetical protein